MLNLINSGLFGGQLFHVATADMVRRYNLCLEDIGLDTTALTEFHIDGLGWSPEIAEEQHNREYLSHGVANPYGIIISPEQRECSLYYPYHSFDWEIHHEVFEKYGSQINDITAECGLWITLDQEISAYRAPQDLLMFDLVKVHFKATGNLIEAAREQRELVRRFNDGDMAWADRELREKIAESGRTYGDLRYRDLDLITFPFSNIKAFYSSAFGGLFVLRDKSFGKPVIVFQNNGSKMSGDLQHAHVEYNLNDPALLTFLFSNRFVEHSYSHFQKEPALLDHQMGLLIAKACMEANEVIDLVNITPSKLLGLVNKLVQKGVLSDAYFELEELKRCLERMESFKSDKEDLIRDHLIHPSQDIDPQIKAVLWQMLSIIFEVNEVIRYTFNKPEFYARFNDWPEFVQDWVISEIQHQRGIFDRLTKA